jgi:endogenous inhibitor of DNA gyrase (YacG/DUF329 family)
LGERINARCPDCDTVIAVLNPVGFPAGATIRSLTLKAWCPICMEPVMVTVI